MRRLTISKPQIVQAMAQFVSATAGRNMTTAAYVAVTIGVAVMVLLTVAPAYEAAHHWVDAVLWTCWPISRSNGRCGFASPRDCNAPGLTSSPAAAWWMRLPPSRYRWP